MLKAYSKISGLAEKKLAEEKHSSVFFRHISDEEKKFYKTVATKKNKSDRRFLSIYDGSLKAFFLKSIKFFVSLVSTMASYLCPS